MALGLDAGRRTHLPLWGGDLKEPEISRRLRNRWR